MKPVEQTKKLLENRIFQSVIIFASIAAISWGWSAYHSVEALPDSLDSLEKRIVADSTRGDTAIEELSEEIEAVEEDVEELEDAVIRIEVKQEAIIKGIDKILEKMDED